MARQCTHKRAGIVTSHPDGDIPRSGGYAMRDCCARPACIAAAQSWVAGITNRPGVWVPDSERVGS